MEVLHPRCCGLDVHKSTISACILPREAGRVQKQQRRFGAMTQDLRELAEWLRQFGVTQVAMNSAAFTKFSFDEYAEIRRNYCLGSFFNRHGRLRQPWAGRSLLRSWTTIKK